MRATPQQHTDTDTHAGSVSGSAARAGTGPRSHPGSDIGAGSRPADDPNPGTD